MMAAFVTMVTETDGKPANEYEYVEGSEPVYRKKLQGGPRLFDLSLCCCAPECILYMPICLCCMKCNDNQNSTSAAVKKQQESRIKATAS